MKKESAIDAWVKISVILQSIIAVIAVVFTYYQFSLNRQLAQKDLLEKSYRIKESAAEVIFKNDPRKLNDARLRNILEWMQEKPK